jgi:PST family polysaccharide transporter
MTPHNTDPAGKPLLPRVARALSWSFVNGAISRVGQVVVGVFLARILVPEDFGVFAVALVVFNVVMSVNELGVSLAIVRWPGDVSKIAPTVTTLALGSSSLLTALCVVAAPFVAATMGAPEATGVLRALSLAIAIAGLSAVPGALLQREFLQERRLVADTANFVVSTTVAIALALAGLGAWSLAWSRVAGNGVAAVLLHVLAPQRYRPGFDRHRARELLAFGLPLAGASFLVFAVLNVDYVVVGRVLGPVALGFYLLAFNLSSWPVNALTTSVRSVSLPGFARLLDDPERLGRQFARSLGWVATFTVPVVVLMSALAGPLITAVYGAKWAGAAPALTYLALLGGMRVAFDLAYDYLAARAQSNKALALQALWLASLVPALAIGARTGHVRGAALAHLVIAATVVVPAYVVVLRREHVRPRDLVRAVQRPLFGGALAAATALASTTLVDGIWLQLIVGTAAGAVAYAAVVGPTVARAVMSRRRMTLATAS